MTKKWNRFLLPILTVLFLTALIAFSSAAMADGENIVTITFSGIPDGNTKIYDNIAVVPTATASWKEGADTKSELFNVSITKDGETVGEAKNAGTYTVTASKPDQSIIPGGYTIPSDTDTAVFTINAAPVSVTVNGSTCDPKEYTGSEQIYEGTVSATSTDFTVDDSKFSYNGTKTVSGTNAQADPYTTSIVETQCSYNDPNYSVRFIAGTSISMKIVPKPVSVTVNGSTCTPDKVYTGSEQTYNGTVASSTTVGFTVDPNKFSYSGAVSGTNASDTSYTAEIDPGKCSYSDTNYSVTFIPGTRISMKIKKAELAVRVDGGIIPDKTYNGQAQTGTGVVTPVETSSTGLLNLIGFNYTGDKTVTGTEARNTPYTTAIVEDKCTYTNTTNCTVTFTVGTPISMKINKAELAVTVNGSTIDPKTYNGQDQTGTGDVTPEETSSTGLLNIIGFSYTGDKTVTGKNASETAYTTAIDTAKCTYTNTSCTVTFTAGTPISMLIGKRTLTVVPEDRQSKVFDTSDPAEGWEFSVTAVGDEESTFDYKTNDISGTLTRVGAGIDSFTIDDIPDGEKAGTHDDYNIRTLNPSSNVILQLVENPATLTIEERTVKITPDAGQSKAYVAANPELYTSTVDPGDDAVHPDFYRTWINADGLARKPGECVGTYEYDFDNVQDTKTESIIVDPDENECFTITEVFAGEVTFKNDNDIMTSRTQSMKFSVGGFGVVLNTDEASELFLDVPATVPAPITTATVAGRGGDYVLDINPGHKMTTDPTSQKNYIPYLAPGTYNAKLRLPKKDGGTVIAKKAGGSGDDFTVAVPVKSDSIPSLDIFNNNEQNEKRDLYGEETKDTISFLMGGKFATETRAWTAGSDQEILKLEFVVNGDSISELTRYIEISKIDKYQIDSELHDYLDKYAATHGVLFNRIPFTIKATIATPGMTATSVSHDYNYDYQMLPLTDERIVNLDNRAFTFTVNLPELSRITKIAISGFNPIDPETIKYESSDSKHSTAVSEGYGLTATVPLSYNTAALPVSSQCVLEIETEDYAGNTAKYTMNGIPMAVSNGIGIIRIEPQAYFGKGEGYSIRETNVIRLSGMGTGFETMSINFATTTGWRLSRTLTIPSSDPVWSPNMDDYWEVSIGNRRSEESLREQLDFPSGIPIEVTLTYQDVLSGGYRTILLYDEEVQDTVELTPAFPGMRVLIGITEPLSTVTLTWNGGTTTAYVNPWGLYILELPEGIIDPEVTLTITDVAGNTRTKKITIPGRKSEVDMVRDACPMGALIQDETGMIKGFATPVNMAELDAGPVELPMLVAQYFKVGTMTVAKDSDGKVTFTPKIDKEFAAANAGTYFNVFTKKPTAEQVEKETRGAGMDYTAGYTPADGTEVFWFVFETQATLTEDQLTLSNNPAIVNPSVDAEFNRLQTIGN